MAADKQDRLPALARELVGMNLDLIVAWATPAVHAVQNTTKTIPIVMGSVADPLATGFVASLAHPGGNITGASLMAPELAGKRIELLRELIPKLSRVAFLAQGTDPAGRVFVKEAQDAGRSLGIHIQPVVVNGPEEFESAFAAMIKERAGALVIQPLFLIGGHGPKLADLAVRNRLPTASDKFQFADIGGLMYYGPDRFAVDRRVATYVDKILKGAKPADLPVEQPTKFEFVINLKTAKALNLTIPQTVLFRANRVIQ